jgi:hypothetical protein
MEKAKYMLLSHHQNANPIQDIKIANRLLKMCHSSNIWGRQREIKIRFRRRLNSGNACYHSVQNLLSSRLLSENVKIRIRKTIILPVVLYGCETRSLTLREEHGSGVSEKWLGGRTGTLIGTAGSPTM